MTGARENHASLCDAKDSVLLIVDIQKQLTAVMPAKVLARLQRNTGLLIRTAHKLAVPIFITERDPEGLGGTETEIQKLLPAATKQYEKTSFSCTSATDFTEDLISTNRKQAILIGMEAHVCILQSALDLNNRGYVVFVVADAVCSRQRENYETALRRLRKAGIIVCDAESVLFEWLRGADPSLSREVQGLIR